MNKSKQQQAASRYRRERFMSILTVFAIVAVVGVFVVLLARTTINHDQLRDLKQYSNADHGDTIEEFIQNVGYEDSEHIAIFNLDGEKLFEYTAEDNAAVELPENVYYRLFGQHQSQDLIAVHNHPGEFETPFSSSDMRTIHDKTPYIEQIVVTRSKVFILRQNGANWPTYGQVNLFLEVVKQQLNEGNLLDHFVLDEATGNLYAGDKFVQAFCSTFNLRYDQTTVEDFNFADWTP